MTEYLFSCPFCHFLNSYRAFSDYFYANINCSQCDRTVILQVRSGQVITADPSTKFIPWDQNEYL